MCDKENKQELALEKDLAYVDQVYCKAVHLHVNYGKSWRLVLIKLVNEGVSEEDALIVVGNLSQQERKAKQKAANKEIIYGAFWALFGIAIAITIVVSGQFVPGVIGLFYGSAIWWGTWTFIKGVYHKCRQPKVNLPTFQTSNPQYCWEENFPVSFDN